MSKRQASEVTSREGVRKGFFTIDQRTFSNVCALGRNAATAYVVLARGSGRDNKTSAWSVNSIEKYTGISRGRAKKAIECLIESGYLQRTGTATRPRYKLLSWDESHSCERQPLSPLEQEAIALVSAGESLLTRQKHAAYRAENKGWLRHSANSGYEMVPDGTKENLVWLPNTLVIGAADETPPLERVRQTGDVMVLRLLVDLYHSQNLREDGGISRSVIYREWERFEAAQYGEFTVWGFTHGDSTTACQCDVVKAHWDNDAETSKEKYAPFWPRLHSLEDCGLIEWVPCLFESDDADAEIIHPLVDDDSGSLEDRLGRAAQQAGNSMLTEMQHERAYEHRGVTLVVPIKRHMANVQLISVARLRYRPHTKLTAAWWAETNTVCEAHISEYEALESRASQGQTYSMGTSG